MRRVVRERECVCVVSYARERIHCPAPSVDAAVRPNGRAALPGARVEFCLGVLNRAFVARGETH
jgi:hypothetical protein